MDLTLAFLLSALVLCLVAGKEYPQRAEIHNIRDFVQENQLIGKEINCTEEEKECFSFNRVLQPDGKCYMLQHRGHCENMYLLQFNKTKAHSGKYQAECIPWFQCGTAEKILMGYDAACYPSELFYQMCDRRNTRLALYSNFFGEYSCRCFGDDCPPAPTTITQPSEPRRCRIPDLAREGFPYLNNFASFRPFPCSSEEHNCLARKQMLFGQTGSCHSLLERGPCAEGERFVANKTAFQLQGLLQAACAVPACPQGQVRMQFDGKCYRREDVLNKLCPPEDLVYDVFGDGGCGGDRQRSVGQYLPQYLTRDNQCTDWSYMNYDKVKDQVLE